MIHRDEKTGTCKYCDWVIRNKSKLEELNPDEQNEFKTIAEYVLMNQNPTVNELAFLLCEEDVDIVCQKIKHIKLNKHIVLNSICDYCGTEFTETPSAHLCTKHHFCCKECYHKYKQQNEPKGQDSKYYKRVETTCCTCGKKILVIPSKKNRTNIYGENFLFCSLQCYWKHRSEYYTGEKSVMYGKTFTQDELDAMRKRMLINAREASRLDSKPQLLLNDMLDQMGINYQREAIFDYYATDNYLFDNELVIEVMGDYWHANPIKYGDGKLLNSIQDKTIIKDKQKKTYLLNHYNLPILYLWETDILHSRDLCIHLINLFVSSGGILQNYHSFNYIYYDDIGLQLSNNLIVPYQDMERNSYINKINLKNA